MTYRDPTASNAALAEMEALRDRIKERLRANPDYVALQAIEHAIENVQSTQRPQRRSVPAAPFIEEPQFPIQNAFEGMTQASAVELMLSRVFHEPSPTGELVERLKSVGIEVGGANPFASLSSVLSKDGRFRSVRYKGRPCWWFKNRPVPGELKIENGEAVTSP